jgi:ABC-type cobalamin/Fe3+-siderophores transport system ATPase subunit
LGCDELTHEETTSNEFAMLTVRELSVSHGGTPILKNLSLSIEPGVLTVLLGRNGAGKSTLLQALAGGFYGV